MAQFDNVSVKKKANVYFDGKCVSHTVLLPNGTRSTIGVIFPSSLTFNTAAPELMEINLGSCKVRLKGEENWKSYGAGEKFTVPGNSSFDIEVTEMLDYVCHFEQRMLGAASLFYACTVIVKMGLHCLRAHAQQRLRLKLC